MNAIQAREIALVQALDETAPEDWQPADRAWASEAASLDTGLSAKELHESPHTRDAWLTARSTRALERLRERGSRWPKALTRARWPRLTGPALAVTALIAGLLVDALAGGRQLNLLSPPFLVLLAWNLVTYLILALDALRGGSGVPWPLPDGRAAPGSESGHEATRQRFSALWAEGARPLYRARALAWLHLAAALFAAGLIASLYWRGLAVEYRAGWDSTFLDAVQVTALLHGLLGPASWLTGTPLPDVVGVAALRFSAGDGENAARWIHLFALTLLLVVVVPRMLMAAWQAARAGHVRSHMPWPLDSSYVRGLLPPRPAAAVRHPGRTPGAGVVVLPYGMRPSEAALAQLRATLETARVAEPWRLGDEDDLPLPQTAGKTIVLFNLAATPEAEHHGRLLTRFAVEGRQPPIVVVDESSFLQRFAGDASRVETRREAWRRLLGSNHTPVFVALDDPGPGTLEDLAAAGHRPAVTATPS